MSDQERQDILKKHQELYNGYAVGNVPTNITPLTVYDSAGDKGGITVTNKGEVKQYTNNRINEITAKPLNYDEIDQAYEFDSDGPQQSMTQMGMGKKPFSFKSKGPSDVYEDEFNEIEDLEKWEDVPNAAVENVEDLQENINECLKMFKRFKNYN